MPDVNVNLTAKDLAPLRGATQLISLIPGGLRRLRPPATFFATLRVAEVSQLCSYLCEPWVLVRWIGEPRSGDSEFVNRDPLLPMLLSQLQLGFAQSSLPTIIGHVILNICHHVKTTCVLHGNPDRAVERLEVSKARHPVTGFELHGVPGRPKFVPFRFRFGIWTQGANVPIVRP